MINMAEEENYNEDNNDEAAEIQHFHRVFNAFKKYRWHSLMRVVDAEESYKKIPQSHQKLLSNMPEQFKQLRICIEHNYEIIKLILENVDGMFENKDDVEQGNEKVHVRDFDMDKVKTVLRQFVRDWSSDGQAERDACYKPVLNEIDSLFSKHECNRADIAVLVPGAGLGRLAFEIARKGYRCQGNEFSLFMLFAANFVLNRCGTESDTFTFYPWVHHYCNNWALEHQTKAVTFPDICPQTSSDACTSDFSMAAGDFVEVYTNPDEWDCVSTVFFIDTAHNIVEYIETIWKILKPGGYWINFGPLLYHFAEVSGEVSIELSWDDLRKVILKLNFEIIKEEVKVPASYTQNPNSMLSYKYDCVYFVARKIVKSDSSENS